MISLYNYFQRLASQNIDIAHTSTKKHFYRLDLDEVLNKLPSGIHFPAMILEGYGISFTDKFSDNVMKNNQCAFYILKGIKDINNIDEKVQAFDDAEQIALEILRRLKHDKRNFYFLSNFDFNEAEGIMVENTINYAVGWRFVFPLSTSFDADLTTNKWADGGNNN